MSPPRTLFLNAICFTLRRPHAHTHRSSFSSRFRIFLFSFIFSLFPAAAVMDRRCGAAAALFVFLFSPLLRRSFPSPFPSRPVPTGPQSRRSELRGATARLRHRRSLMATAEYRSALPLIRASPTSAVTPAVAAAADRFSCVALTFQVF